LPYYYASCAVTTQPHLPKIESYIKPAVNTLFGTVIVGKETPIEIKDALQIILLATPVSLILNIILSKY